MHAPLIALALATLPQARPDVDLLAGLGTRSIGPAGMSGRVAAIEALPADPRVVYVGAATGGLWRTRNAGLDWEPLFDDRPVASIGSIALDPERPHVVWVGTGEGNPRNSSSVGDGVFRSRDAGATWTHVGLEGTERVHRLLLDPRDGDVAWAAALGTSWGESAERGVYRTADGGASWEQVLFVDERTGCADLAMAPNDPDFLIAAMWDHRREPDFFRSGGPGSGLHVTRDGGRTWTRLDEEDGLPSGELGRIGVAFSRSDPSVVYALVEAKKSALCRSDDGGRTWSRVNEQHDVAQRPFYYADIRVDPRDPDRVYSLASVVKVSDDGGRSFETLIPWSLIHPDHHALWIHPEDPDVLIDGNDGGVAFSRDRGASWRFARNLPLAQYYHLSVDDELPYNVYGGMQDNGSWRGPSSVWENGGIRNHHWREVGFGDGFATIPTPGDPNVGYAMSQGGFLLRWNLATGERKNIRPDEPADAELRFNWNAGLALDPFDRDTIYYGSQFVHRSTDRGDTWEIVSPDLTTNDPAKQRQDDSGGLTPDVTAAENFTAILTIAPSPVDRDVVWVGTDDGRLHVTRDGAESWTSVEANVSGVPRGTWIPHVEASRHDAAVAYAVFDDHRRANGATYVARTRDFGRSWESLSTSELSGYAHVIEEDPVDPDLLWLGTEFGLWLSLDGGGGWAKWTHGFPTVAVRALTVHPTAHDLVVGTHGRAAWIVDDVRPLRTLTDVAGSPFHLFAVPAAYQHRVAQTGESRFPGTEEFRGENRPYGALVTFWLDDESLPHPDPDVEKERKRAERAAEDAASPGGGAAAEDGGPAEEGEAAGGEASDDGEDDDEGDGAKARVEILDADGEVIRTWRPKVHRGLNRVVWNLRRRGLGPLGADEPPKDEPAGLEVPPGTYSVRVSHGGQSAVRPVEVLADPRQTIAPEDRAANWAAQLEAEALARRVHDAVERIGSVRADVERVRALAGEGRDPWLTDDEAPHPHRAVLDAADELTKALAEAEKLLWSPPKTKGIVARDRARDLVGRAQWTLGSSWERPTSAGLAQLAKAEAAVAEALAALNGALTEELAAFRAAVDASGLALLPERPPLEVP